MSIAIITGASSGIGEAFLSEVVNSTGKFGGTNIDAIWIIARRADRLEALKKKYSNSNIVPIEADLTSEEGISIIEHELSNKKPTIGLLINCAGLGKRGKVIDRSKDDLSSTLDVNCKSLSILTRLCLPYMVCTGGAFSWKQAPRIINLGSSAAFLPQPGFACYAASKAYVLSFSRALSYELHNLKIAVTVICPGPVNTEFLSKATDSKESKFTGIRAMCVLSPEKLAKKGMNAAMRGRHLYVCGFMQKCLYLASKIVPTSWILSIEKILMPS